MSSRLYYLDNLRTFATVLVVLHHTIEPWATGKGLVPMNGQSLCLAAILGINASFFMGLFFFISGYFTRPSLVRKGAAKFCRDRLLRLGLPALLFGLLVNPPMFWLLGRYEQGEAATGLLSYAENYLLHRFSYGHLWFVVLLLEFSLLYALWRRLSAAGPEAAPRPIPAASALGNRSLLLVTLGLAAGTFLARVYFPQDKWIAFAGIIQLEPAHFPQYALMFCLGVLCGKNGWLEALSLKKGLAWLALGWAPTLLLAPVNPKQAFLGSGFTLAGVLTALREAFMCVGMILGLLAIFKTRFNRAGAFAKMLSANAYTVYIIHIPIMVLLQCWVRGFGWGPVPSALTTFILVPPICWPLSHFVIRRLPGFGRVLG